MRLNLTQAINEIKIKEKENDSLNKYFDQIIVFNSTVKINIEFSSKRKALKFSYVLQYKINQIFDDPFKIVMMYFDETRTLKSHTSQFQKAVRARVTDACPDHDARIYYDENDCRMYQRDES